MITELFIGNEKLDLNKDDSITIKSAIAKSEDISKVFTDTSNGFSVPATDNNNRIFKHYYNASVNNPFDARKLVLGAIYLDGIHYKTGNFKLNKVIVKSQKASSYSLDFFGLLTQLKGLLGDDKLSDLPLTSEDYDYTYTNVLVKLTDDTPLKNVSNSILTNKRYIYDSDAATDNTATIKNLADNDASADSGLDWYDTSSSLLNIKIIEAIETLYGLTFSRDFFGNDAFAKLYLLLNGGAEDINFEEQIVFDVATTDPTLQDDTILLSTALTFNDTNLLRISIDLQDVNTDTFTSVIKANGVEIHSITGQGRSSDGVYVYLVYKDDFAVFENLTFHLKSEKYLNYKYTVDRNVAPLSSYKSERDTARIVSTFKIADKIPDIKVIDYLKGLFKTYKLVVIPTSETEMYVDTLENYYKNGTLRNVTGLIDFSNVPITTGKLLNEINYNFQEGETVLAKQFRTNTGVDYGSLELKITDSNGKLIEGGKLDIEVPFSNMVYEKLADVSGIDTVNVLYGLMADYSLESVKIKPHLHYINNVALDSDIKIIQTPSTVATSSTLNLPSHTLGYSSILYSTVFGEEFNEYNGVKIVNTLYSNYHKTYIDNIFNEKKRSYSFSIKNATMDLIHNLKLNDVLEIKQRLYRIESFDTNIIKKEIKLKLVNAINVELN